MKVKYVNDVRNALGQDAIEVLTDVFVNAKGLPPGVPAARYRADHSKWIEIIDRLESSNLFLDRGPEGKNIIIRVYGLPLIEEANAKVLLRLMEQIFQFFKSEYGRRLSEPIAFMEIVEALKLNSGQAAEALSYMVQSHDVWCGLSTGFPLGESPVICISEQVLRHENFGEILSQFYEWHIVNPHKKAEGVWPTVNSSNLSIDGFFTQSDLSLRPKWFEELDDIKKALVGEIDKAIREDLSALPMIGLRTLLETVMLDHINDQGRFSENINKFYEAGYITRQHVNLLEKVVNAGNASAHRAYFPNKEDLKTCSEVLKYLLHGVYVLKPKVDKVAENTPARKKK